MTDDLIKFLRGRLDEDEQAARDARTAPPPRTPGGWPHETEILHGAAGMGVPDAAIGCYLVHGNPARVLAEVDAKRQILDWHSTTDDVFICGTDGEFHTLCRCTEEPPCPTIRLLALHYRDRPDYRHEWAATI